MTARAEPTTEALSGLAAACERALERLHDSKLPYPPDPDLVALTESVRDETVMRLADRLVRTNTLFREANVAIAAAARQMLIDPIPLICECAAIRCTTIVKLSAIEVDELRANPRWFLTLPEHELESGPHARVVADRGSYLIIENIGVAAVTAAALPAQ